MSVSLIWRRLSRWTGWSRRTLAPAPPPFLPAGVLAGPSAATWRQLAFFPVLLLACNLGLRLLEIPFWDTPAAVYAGEYLLATHDAYHWVAGAEGFEFGAGHPMSELLRVLARWTGAPPAAVAFWLPAPLSGLLCVAVFLWGWALGFPRAGACAGLLAALSPIFFARTMLGYGDTDLLVVPLAVLVGLGPAVWLHPWLVSPLEFFRERRAGARRPSATERAWSFGDPGAPGALALDEPAMRASMLAWPWLALLVLSGLFAHHTQVWHSFFLYLVRYSAVLTPLLILVLGPRGGRHILLRGALCHIFPLLLGTPGLYAALGYSIVLVSSPRSLRRLPGGRAIRRALFCLHRLAWDPRSLYVLWAAAAVACLDVRIVEQMVGAFRFYALRKPWHSMSQEAGWDPLVFPPATDSIIETQRVDPGTLLVLLYPVGCVAAAALVSYLTRLLRTPVLAWFLPLVLLAPLSLVMGVRMVLFAAPPLLLALCLESASLARWSRNAFPEMLRRMAQRFPGHAGRLEQVLARGTRIPARVRRNAPGCAALLAALALAWPLLVRLPAYHQGAIISPGQAAALTWLREHAPPEAMIWTWWDWGYAAHHFARRTTIADGARHGGPSLYLPAAVYTAADPRFARQLIAYTAMRGNAPHLPFQGRSTRETERLFQRLTDPQWPLVPMPGKQYLVVSFELLRISQWVARYGSWDFRLRRWQEMQLFPLYGKIVYDMQNGTLVVNNSRIAAETLDVFSGDGLLRGRYPHEDAGHFILHPEPEEHRAALRRALENPVARFWKNQTGFFRPGTPANEMWFMDDDLYATLMVQLLVAEADDPRFVPYFTLVYDGVDARVYEVR